jgi:hypothetical protein
MAELVFTFPLSSAMLFIEVADTEPLLVALLKEVRTRKKAR